MVCLSKVDRVGKNTYIALDKKIKELIQDIKDKDYPFIYTKSVVNAAFAYNIFNKIEE
jgi:hypothetical protein